MAHGNHDGILANQNINDYQAMQNLITDVPEAKWEENLGRGRGYASEGPGWAGYSWGPPNISDNPLNNDIGDQLRGPQGNTPELWLTKADFEGGKPAQYGPEAFAQLATGTHQGQPTGSTYSSVLSSLAWMIAGGWDGKQDLQWSDKGSGPGMKETFTNGKQAVSLRIADIIPGGRPGAGQPVASGGATKGYQFDHIYGISNWNATEGAGARTAVTTAGATGTGQTAGQEEITPANPNGQGDTGLRKMSGMKTPASTSNEEQGSQG